MTLALTSDTMPLQKVEDLADTNLAQKISQVSGVGLVSHQRRPEAGCSHPGEPDRARFLRHQSRRSTYGLGAANVDRPKAT